MKTILFLMLLSIGSVYGQQSLKPVEEQLRLKYSDSYLSQLEELSPNIYRFYGMELLHSYEFVDLEVGHTYPELIPFNYLTKEPKPAPVFNVKTFSLYDYKFNRPQSEDMTFRIPGSDKGVLIYSKEKFLSKL